MSNRLALSERLLESGVRAREVFPDGAYPVPLLFQLGAGVDAYHLYLLPVLVDASPASRGERVGEDGPEEGDVGAEEGGELLDGALSINEDAEDR